jgi:hypothetical protein
MAETSRAVLRKRIAALERAHYVVCEAFGGWDGVIFDGPCLRLSDSYHWPEEEDGPIELWRVIMLLDAAAARLEEELQEAETMTTEPGHA